MKIITMLTMLAWLVQSFPIHIGYNRQYFTLFEPPLLQYWMLFLEFFCTECIDKFCRDASGFIYGLNLFRGCLGASAVEVEGHEVYVSAPEWRLLFLGSGCNNNYVYTERSSSGIQLPYSMYMQTANTPLMQNPRHYLIIKTPRELVS